MCSARQLLVSCMLLCTAGCGVYALPAGATTQAQVLRQDWTVFTFSGLFVAVVVFGLILFPLFAWRRRRNDYPPQFSRNSKLELIYTIIPLLMVISALRQTFLCATRSSWSISACTQPSQSMYWPFSGRGVFIMKAPQSIPWERRASLRNWSCR